MTGSDKKAEGGFAGSSVNLLFAGGGTGGHLYPGIAVADAVCEMRPGSKMLFTMAGRSIEKLILTKTPYETALVPASPFMGKGLYGKARGILQIPAGILASINLFRRFRPDAVVGLGGYASVPVCLAARIYGLIYVICEQNREFGLANRMLSPFADRIYLSFEEARVKADPGKVLYTGNPVRPEIVSAAAIRKASKDKGKFTVLVFGGSQGASPINRAVADALKHLKRGIDIKFIHQSGSADYHMILKAYEKAGIEAEVVEFIEEMGDAYSKADLAVCRAGATTVAEIAAAGIPAIFIPFGGAAKDHQTRNAKVMSDAGAAILIPETKLSGPRLASEITRLASNDKLLAAMGARALSRGRPDAAYTLAMDLLGLIDHKRSGKDQIYKRGSVGC